MGQTDRETDRWTDTRRCIMLTAMDEACVVKKCSYHQSRLTSPYLNLSELNVCEATQFAVAATNHSALSSDEMRSVVMRSDEVSWDELYERSVTTTLDSSLPRAACMHNEQGDVELRPLYVHVTFESVCLQLGLHHTNTVHLWWTAWLSWGLTSHSTQIGHYGSS